MMDKLAAASLPRSRTIRSCSTSRARRAARPSPTIARPATAPAAAAPRAIPISTTTTGCGAASSTISQQTIRHGARSGDDKAPSGQHAGVRPRRHAQARRDRGGRRLCALAVRACRRARASISRAGKKCSPTIAPPVTATDGKGNRELGAPNLTDADLALRVRQGRRSCRRHQERPRRRDAGLGGRLTTPTIKALAVYVYTLRRRREMTMCQRDATRCRIDVAGPRRPSSSRRW